MVEKEEKERRVSGGKRLCPNTRGKGEREEEEEWVGGVFREMDCATNM